MPATSLAMQRFGCAQRSEKLINGDRRHRINATMMMYSVMPCHVALPASRLVQGLRSNDCIRMLFSDRLVRHNTAECIRRIEPAHDNRSQPRRIHINPSTDGLQ